MSTRLLIEYILIDASKNLKFSMDLKQAGQIDIASILKEINIFGTK